jgi:hypothetical protein
MLLKRLVTLVKESLPFQPTGVLLHSSFSRQRQPAGLPPIDDEYAFRLRLGSRGAILFFPLQSLVSTAQMLNVT